MVRTIVLIIFITYAMALMVEAKSFDYDKLESVYERKGKVNKGSDLYEFRPQ